MGNTRKKKRERNIQMKRSIEYGYRKNEKKKRKHFRSRSIIKDGMGDECKSEKKIYNPREWEKCQEREIS